MGDQRAMPPSSSLSPSLARAAASHSCESESSAILNRLDWTLKTKTGASRPSVIVPCRILGEHSHRIGTKCRN